jgi:hypothetical protein
MPVANTPPTVAHPVIPHCKLPARLSSSTRRRLRALLRQPPPLVDGPLEAFARRSENAAFSCSLDRFTHPTGWAFARWNPFVAAAREIVNGLANTFQGSILDRYYRIAQPRDAADALFGFTDPPAGLNGAHPVAALCTPWASLGPSAIVPLTHRWVLNDHREHGHEGVGLEAGFKWFGPVTRVLGEIEFARLIALVDSLQRHGYRRRRGDVLVNVLRRGDDYRVVNSGGGLHRTATATAIGMGSLPVRPVGRLIDVDLAADWPNVRNGLWSVQQARRFVDHLFDFDCRDHARALGLLRQADERPDSVGCAVDVTGGGGSTKAISPAGIGLTHP